MYGAPSQLDYPYAIRHRMAFHDKYQRPLTEREKEIIEHVKKESFKVEGFKMPAINYRVLNSYKLNKAERRVIIDEVKGRTGNERRIRPPLEPPNPEFKRKRVSYMDLLRCGGNTKLLQKQKAKKATKSKYVSYAEARKRRERFRQRLVEIIMHRDEWDDETEEPAHPGAPLTTKEKDLLRYYYYIHNGIDTRYVANINQKWFKRIMALVPRRLLKHHKEIKKIHDEIKEDYLFAVKKSVVDFVLKEPEIDEDERFLDEDDETPLTIELAGVSLAWRKLYKNSRKHLRFNLHPISNFLSQNLSLWYKSYDTLRFIKSETLSQSPKMEMMNFQDKLYHEVEKTKNLLKTEWLQQIFENYKTCKKKKSLPLESRMPAMLNSLSVQMTLQVQNMCLMSIHDFDRFIGELNDVDGANGPGFVVHLKMMGNKIVFYPTFEDIKGTLIDTYDTIIHGASEIPRFESVLLDSDDECKIENLKPTILPETIDKVKKNVEIVMENQNKVPQNYVKEYDKFMFLIDGRAEVEIETYVKEEHTFEEFSTKVKYFDDLSQKLTCSLPKEVNLGMYELHCEDLISSLYRKVGILKESILKQMSKDHQIKNQKLCDEYSEISATALSSPNNTEELVQLKEKVDNIKNVDMIKKEAELNQAAQRLVFLSDYLQFTTSEMKLNTKTFQWHAKMPKIFNEHQKIIQEKTTDYQKALKLRRERFIEELEAYNNQVDDFYGFGDVDELPKYMKKAQTLNTKLSLCKEKIEQFNMEENAFDWELTNYPLMEATVNKLKPFLRLYETSMEFMNKQKIWLESPMGSHDPKDIENEVDSSWKLVSQLESDFCEIPAAQTLVINVREKIEEFRDKMPIIKTLGNPGFRERHWEHVSNTVGFPIKGGEETNLFKILDMGLDEYVNKFDKISEAATKEYNLEKSMQQMVEEWSEMEFTITPYGETGTYILQSMDSIQVLLDDHIVKTQTMRGSPFIKPFEEDIGKWEIQLLLLQEIMDEWLKVQSVWLYLEPIFGSPDIMAQMPEEGRRFTTVDKNWRDIMKAAIVDKHVLKVVEIDRILEKLKKSNELLDLIGKGLNDYLERKRQCFPRFFFMSNSELLEILSETKDPRRVRAHLTKCFEGIANLEFDNELEVTKIISATEETIPLVKTISTVKARGQVDKWLSELEIQMRESLKAQISTLSEEYDFKKVHDYPNKFPSQAILCVNTIYWTSKIQSVIKNGSKGLAEVRQNIDEFMNLLSELVLSTENPSNCQIYANLILSQGYFYQILNDDFLENVSSADDFSWMSRLRYYWVDGTVHILMVDSKLIYGFEYLKEFTKLVMTPMTERCYQTLLMAIDLHLGGLLSGETATGKTETIKDLARAAAKQCVSFNCSEEFHYRAFAKFLKGLVCCGAWSCFDEFHRIDSQVLSVIGQQMFTIQRSIQTKVTSIFFEDSEVKINPSCAMFTTTNSLSSLTSEIPDNLRVLFRPVALSNPDNALIAEVLLQSKGFKETKELSKRIASMVELCDGLLSSQPHYEFGLRSIISVLRSAGTFKKANQEEDEYHLVSKALQTVKYCELLPQDQKMFRDILKQVFKQCPPDPLPDDILRAAIIEQCSKNNLEGTPYFLSKVQQLYDMMDLFDGVMLLGGPFGGKTKACHILASSLKCSQEKSQKGPATVILNPKALKIQQLFGYFDNDEWKDGILAKNFRWFTSLPKEERKWLIFDGPVDSDWIENMNTVLDENKKLCLMSGEIIPLPPNTNLIFEAQDVESASPATISRCGVLYMDPNCLKWNLLVKNWIKTFPNFIPEQMKEMIVQLFDVFCNPLLLLVKKISSLTIMEHHLIKSLINIFDCYLNPLLSASQLKGKSEHELQPFFEGMFFFSCIWSIGAVCNGKSKETFNRAFHELLQGMLSDEIKSLAGYEEDENAKLTHTFVMPVPRDEDVFAYKLAIGTKAEWHKWSDTVKTSSQLPRDIFACQLIISTVETEKYYFLMELLVKNATPFILVGPSGTGKSVYIQDLLNRKLEKDKFTSTSLYFTSNTSPTETRSIVISKLDKRRKGVFGPPLGKKFIIFVDDINMPMRDEVGCQPPIELLRQLLDHNIWYDPKELSPMKLIDMQLIGAMRLPDGSSNNLPNRFVRHFNTITIDLFSDETVATIYRRIVLWHLDTKGFSKEFDPCIDQLVLATLDLHKYVVANLLPTPDHPHYKFSLKEISRVICGVLLSVPETMSDLNSMKRLWVHEVLRVYHDRLVYDEDSELFLTATKNVCQDRLKIDFQELCSVLIQDEPEKTEVTNEDLRKLIFCDFSDPQNDEKFYKEIPHIDEMRICSEELLEKYNTVSRKPMSLVLFDFALEHLSRICRSLKQPESHMLLIGVGGSGRQCLTRLASYIADHEFYQIEMGKEYGVEQWRNELKTILKKTSLTIKPFVLFIYDTQMIDDKMYEDINYILYSGEVPNVFNVEEKLEIVENMKSVEKQLDKSQHTDGSGPALFALFVRRIKETMHVVLAVSPFSNSFRNNINRFPALMNFCTINWFHQWPNDALNFVSYKILKDSEIEEEQLKGIVRCCEFFHSSTIELSKEVKRERNIHNYVTPASYLELNSLFKKLLQEHRQKVIETKKKYEISLEKLQDAENQVTTMQEEMAGIQPKLAVASKEVDNSMTAVEKEQTEVAELEKIIKGEDAMANEKKKVVDTIQCDCDAELAEVNGVVDGALDSLASLTQSEIAAVRGLKSPPLSLKLISEAICQLKGFKPDRIQDPSGGSKMIDDYWNPMKRILGDPKFIEILSDFDKENIPSKVAKMIREKYLSNPEINPEKSRHSVAAVDLVGRSLYRWVIAIDMFEKVCKNIAPKRESLEKAEKEYQESIESLDRRKNDLKEAQDKLKLVFDDLQVKKQRKAELENEIELCSRKLERAEQLITSFGGEREKWKQKSDELSSKYNKLTGDMLLSAALVAYLGAFPYEERQAQVHLWKKKAQELNVPCSEDYSLQDTLGNKIAIQTWYINGLLKDGLSTENGIILSTAQRWTLMIDPQDIANRWIKTMEKQKGLTVVKQSDKDFIRSMESCIQFGTPVLLENVGDSIDPVLEPLLQKQTFQQGGSVCIKLGESTIEYSKDFRMYITTRYHNPHFPPETTAKIALINFSITYSGLVDQLLGIIIARERPELEEERSQVIGQNNENKKKLIEIEDKILSVLSTSKGNILEDENAIKTLSSSKVLANEVAEKQGTSNKAIERIEEQRREYNSLANYGVKLFFTLNALSSVNIMYQYSLSWFINLFCTTIDLANKSEELTERQTILRQHFLRNLYLNTVRGLYEEDRLLFSFLLSCIVGDSNDLTDTKAWKEFISFLHTDFNQEDKLLLSLDEKQKKCSKLFPNLENLLSEKKSQFEEINNQRAIDIESLDFLNDYSSFEKVIMYMLLRPDFIIPSIRHFVINNLGNEFIDQELFDINKSYQESTAATPIIILVGEMVDPCKYILQFADEMGFGGRKLKLISMGLGQEEKARSTIKECTGSGSWTVLLNCHLVPHWMDELEYLCEGLNSENVNQDFRLWITTKPSNEFSVPTLQSSVKVALEEPSNMKENLLRHIATEKSVAINFNKMENNLRKYIFSLGIFHAIINERNAYKHCGWNHEYIFGEQDFDLAVKHLTTALKAKDFSCNTFQYLVSGCTYGSIIEDEFDFETLKTLLQSICSVEVQKDDFTFDEDNIYKTKSSELEHVEFVRYLSHLPLDVSETMMNMSWANHMHKNVILGKRFLSKLSCSQGSRDQNAHASDQEMKEKIQSILENLPEEFDIKDTSEILILVLNQELEKYNALLECINETLANVLRAIEGQSFMTEEIEDILGSLKNEEIPESWSEVIYPTVEDLPGFLEDLSLRIEFLKKWQTTGCPAVYWLTAFFEPGDFLIAILYIQSLKQDKSFHEMTFQCEVADTEVESGFSGEGDCGNSENGVLVRGLFLVGAAWNMEKKTLIKSTNDQLYSSMPIMRLTPICEDDIAYAENLQAFSCPLYQNTAKSGEDNYIVSLDLLSEYPSEFWTLSGVSLLCQKPKD